MCCSCSLTFVFIIPTEEGIIWYPEVVLTMVGVRSTSIALVPSSVAGFASVTSKELDPVAKVTGEVTPLIVMLMLLTVKVTEYIVEPFGRLADARVFETFWS